MANCGRSDEDLMVELKQKVGPHHGDRGPLLPRVMVSSEPSDFLKESGRPILHRKISL